MGKYKRRNIFGTHLEKHAANLDTMSNLSHLAALSLGRRWCVTSLHITIRRADLYRSLVRLLIYHIVIFSFRQRCPALVYPPLLFLFLVFSHQLLFELLWIEE